MSPYWEFYQQLQTLKKCVTPFVICYYINDSKLEMTYLYTLWTLRAAVTEHYSPSDWVFTSVVA